MNIIQNKHLSKIISEYLYTTIPFKTDLVNKTNHIYRMVDCWHFYKGKSIKYKNALYDFGIYPIGTQLTSTETYKNENGYWYIITKH